MALLLALLAAIGFSVFISQSRTFPSPQPTPTATASTQPDPKPSPTNTPAPPVVTPSPSPSPSPTVTSTPPPVVSQNDYEVSCGYRLKRVSNADQGCTIETSKVSDNATLFRYSGQCVNPKMVTINDSQPFYLPPQGAAYSIDLNQRIFIRAYDPSRIESTSLFEGENGCGKKLSLMPPFEQFSSVTIVGQYLGADRMGCDIKVNSSDEYPVVRFTYGENCNQDVFYSTNLDSTSIWLQRVGTAFELSPRYPVVEFNTRLSDNEPWQTRWRFTRK